MSQPQPSRAESLGEIGERIIEVFRYLQHEVTVPREGVTHITRSEADIMRIVMEQPGTTVTEIARAFGQHKSNTSTRIGALVEKGLARKENAVGDAREVRVYPTDEAQANLDRFREVWAEHLGPLTTASDAQLARTAAILAELADALAASRSEHVRRG
ncbi:MAG TPA: MarR family transcriptional regulator [Microbacteriaceae bacterium]|nr:MarR family transcriptional regulator [Microbacteriaceae bacterium]